MIPDERIERIRRRGASEVRTYPDLAKPVNRATVAVINELLADLQLLLRERELLVAEHRAIGERADWDRIGRPHIAVQVFK